MTDPAGLPVVCTLSPETLAARKDGLLPGLAKRATRFLRFELTVAPDGGPLRLILTGPPGTGQFLSALIDG